VISFHSDFHSHFCYRIIKSDNNSIRYILTDFCHYRKRTLESTKATDTCRCHYHSQFQKISTINVLIFCFISNRRLGNRNNYILTDVFFFFLRKTYQFDDYFTITYKLYVTDFEGLNRKLNFQLLIKSLSFMWYKQVCTGLPVLQHRVSSPHTDKTGLFNLDPTYDPLVRVSETRLCFAFRSCSLWEIPYCAY
jgi:hypothetical protein